MPSKYLIKSATHQAVIYWRDDPQALKSYMCKKWGCDLSAIITFLRLTK